MSEQREGAFRITGSRQVASAAFLTLEQLEVVGPDEATFERAVVRHTGSVTIVPVDDRDRAVLVRQYRAALDREVLELPAGKRDVDGEAPAETARRELVEEVGLVAGTIEPLCTLDMSPGMCDEVAHLFLATDLRAVTDRERAEGSYDDLRHEEATMTAERIPLAAVPELVRRGELTDAATVVGLLLARERGLGGA